MKKSSKKLAGTVVSLVLLGSLFLLANEGFSGPNLVVNGSFESPVLSPNQQPAIVPDGWGMFTGDAGDMLMNSYSGQAYDGNQYVKIGWTPAGTGASLTQTVSAVAQEGYVYTLTGVYGGQASAGSSHHVVLEAVNPANPAQTLTLIDNPYLIASTWTTFSQTCATVAAPQNNWNLRVKLEVLTTWGTFDSISLTSALGTPNTNLIWNGSFECPMLAVNQQTAIIPAGWGLSVGTAASQLINSYSGEAYDGKEYVKIGGVDGDCALTQTISAVAQEGYAYTLSALYGGNASAGSLHHFVLEAVNPANSAQTLTLIDSPHLGATTWTTYSQTSPRVTSAQKNWNLRVSLEGIATWSTFDNVVLTARPETNLVCNGSFESPALSANSQSSTRPYGWGFSGLDQVLNSYTGEAYDGNQYVKIFRNSALTQTVSEVAQEGFTYTLSAVYGGNSSGGSQQHLVLEAVNPSNPSQTVTLIDSSNLAASTWTMFSQRSAPIAAAQNNWNLRVTLEGLVTWATFDAVVLTIDHPQGTIVTFM